MIKQEPIKTPAKPNSDASKMTGMDMCTPQYLIQIINKDKLSGFHDLTFILQEGRALPGWTVTLCYHCDAL